MDNSKISTLFYKELYWKKRKNRAAKKPIWKILLTLDWLMWVLWPSGLSHFDVVHVTHEEIFHIFGS
jgi:hypothetical protein